MRPPIVMLDGHDITVYATIEAAEASHEVADIRNGGIFAYDSEGHLLEMQIGFIERKHNLLFLKWTARYESIILSDRNPIIDRSDELRRKLIDFLIFKGKIEEELQKASLEELIREIGRYMPWPFKEQNS